MPNKIRTLKRWVSKSKIREGLRYVLENRFRVVTLILQVFLFLFTVWALLELVRFARFIFSLVH